MGPFSGSELLSFLQNNYGQKAQTNTHLVKVCQFVYCQEKQIQEWWSTVDKVESPDIFIGLAKQLNLIHAHIYIYLTI